MVWAVLWARQRHATSRAAGSRSERDPVRCGIQAGIARHHGRDQSAEFEGLRGSMGGDPGCKLSRRGSSGMGKAW